MSELTVYCLMLVNVYRLTNLIHLQKEGEINQEDFSTQKSKINLQQTANIKRKIPKDKQQYTQ